MNSSVEGSFALLSVSDKTGLVEFANRLFTSGYRLLSTGGTARFLREAGLEVQDVSSITEFPEMMDGRVKTLHPRIHGGLLARRDVSEHCEAMRAHSVPDIRVVVVNLYPFSETVARGAEDDEVIENIDIGGPSMIRSAAKNHEFVTVIVDPADYGLNPTELSAHDRRRLALKAFQHTAAYDAAIVNYLHPENEERQALRYGENPHQSASLFVEEGQRPLGGLKQLQGKELSYNNIIDLEAALLVTLEFDAPSVAIIKHTNPCGCASADTINEAFTQALAGDPISAFGGIVSLNRVVDRELALVLAETFWEVIAAPGFDEGAIEVLSVKKNVRLMEVPADFQAEARQVRLTSLGWLEQDADPRIDWEKLEFQVPTEREPTLEEWSAMAFLWRVCKHVKSNAIVVGKGTRTLGVGAGQMSRVDAVRGAVQAAGNQTGLVLASDAFFPFADGIELAAEFGVSAVVQPGGSRRDAEVIEACNRLGVAMVMTGMRHFRH